MNNLNIARKKLIEIEETLLDNRRPEDELCIFSEFSDHFGEMNGGSGTGLAVKEGPGSNEWIVLALFETENGIDGLSDAEALPPESVVLIRDWAKSSISLR